MDLFNAAFPPAPRQTMEMSEQGNQERAKHCPERGTDCAQEQQEPEREIGREADPYSNDSPRSRGTS